MLGLGNSLVRGGVLSGLTNTYSLDFDGTDDYVDCGDTNDFSFGADGTTGNEPAFTLSVWANMDDATNFRFMAKAPTSGVFGKGEYLFETNGLDRLYFWINDDSVATGGGADAVIGRYYDSAVTGDEGAWHHYVATYDGSRASSGLKIYRDGVQVDNQNNQNPAGYVAMENTDDPLWIGRSQLNYTNGKIDEVAMFDAVVTVGDLRNGSIPADLTEMSNLVGWWRMGDGVLDDFNLIADQVNPTLGSEELGTADNDWNVTSGNWSISSGVLTFDGLGTADTTHDGGTIGALTLSTGDTYKLQFTIANSSDARLGFRDNNDTYIVAFTSFANGSYTFYFTVTSAMNGFKPEFIGHTAGSSLDITSYSLKKVNGNPCLMTNMASVDIVKDTP